MNGKFLNLGSPISREEAKKVRGGNDPALCNCPPDMICGEDGICYRENNDAFDCLCLSSTEPPHIAYGCNSFCFMCCENS